MRGEYGANLSQYTDAMELPPRARRIRWSERQKGNHHGTTSACAENTGWWGAHQHIDGNYLRVRGEYIENYQAMRDKTELPPRARRIHLTSRFDRHFRGTTSACAENTHGPPTPHPNHRNYLRVRGEYFSGSQGKGVLEELPPRARRIRFHAAILLSDRRNYLRVRGEYKSTIKAPRCDLELPPRARRIQ